MSYLIQADMTDDENLRRRVIACAATQGIEEAEAWAHQSRWKLSAQPSWVESYADAIANNVPKPGADESVISDARILAAVQSLSR